MKANPPSSTADHRQPRQVVTLVPGDQTAGRLALIELYEVQGQEPPRHLHANEDEILYVLEGTLTVCVDEHVHQAPAGSCFFLSRGTDHGYALQSGFARLLIVLAPAGLEEFVRETGASLSSEGIERLIAVAARYGVSITGPTPTIEVSTSGGAAPPG